MSITECWDLASISRGDKLVALTLRIGIFALCVIGTFGPASVVSAQDYFTSTGTPSFAAPEPAEMGMVDVASGNLHLEIPLGSFPQRGASKPLVPKLVYDSHIWTVPTDGTSNVWTLRTNLYPENFGTWGLIEGGTTGLYRMDSTTSSNGCNADYMLLDGAGTQRYFNVPETWNGSQCSGATTYAVDSSGYRFYQSPWPGTSAYTSMYAPDGTLEAGGTTFDTIDAAKDSNGNRLALTSPNGLPGMTDPVVDTLGRTLVSTPPNGSYNPSGTSNLQVPNSQGGMSYHTVNGTSIPVKTNFQQSGITECSTNCTATVISSVVLPNSSQYSFKYDCNSTTGNAACGSPGGQSAYYGTLISMTLPTGQTIGYGYTDFKDFTGAVSHWLNSKSSSQGTWSYSPSGIYGLGTNTPCLPGNYYVSCLQTVVGKPDNSMEVISLIADPDGGNWPNEIRSTDTNGTLLLTVNNTWDFSRPCTLNLCNGRGFQNVRLLKRTAALPVPSGSITKQVSYAYDRPTDANITSIKAWKYQNGTSPAFSSVPDTATYLTYATIGTNNNIDRLLTETVCNNVGTDSNCPGGGSTIARTTITYDSYGINGSLALASVTGIVNHDDTSFGASYAARGNPTQVSRWVSGSAYLTSALSYDTTRQLVQISDPAGNLTTPSYADKFYSDNGADPPQAFTPTTPTNAYVTKVTDAIGSRSTGYYYGSGKVALATDYNAVTTYGHYTDPLDRPTKADYPIGWSLNTYSSPTQFDSYDAIGDASASTGCVSCTHTQVLLDSLGRISSGNLVNNPAGQVTISNGYDRMNRVSSASHPHIGSADPNNVLETSRYDGLGRSLGVTHPDNQSSAIFYGSAVTTVWGALTSQQGSTATYGVGFPIVSVDEAATNKQEWIDGFGRVIEVDEPSTGKTASKGSFAVFGSEGSTTYYPCGVSSCPTTIYDSGTVTVTINEKAYVAYYGGCSTSNPGGTSSSIAASLATSINGDSSAVVSASLSGSTVSLTSKSSGSGVNYSLSGTSATTCSHFSSASYGVSTSGNSLTGGTDDGAILSSPLVTNYVYDALGNLTRVVQGAQSRSYQYDGLSRLTQDNTPEAGTVTLSYVTASNTLCSGEPTNPCTRTDARAIVTTYSYDSANRLTKKAYSPTAPAVLYTYGTNASLFRVGRLVTMSDTSGTETYSYDKMGRVINLAKNVKGVTYNIGYQYNVGGQLTQITYPSGRIVQYSYDAVGHLCVVAISTSGCGSSSNPYLTIPSSSYDAASRPLSATYGNGVVASATYSPQRSQLATLGYAKGATKLFGLSYYYQKDSTGCPNSSGLGNNGQIQCIADSVQAGRSGSYSYDALGRLLTANTTGSTAYPAWGLSEAYDRYGNRSAQTVTAGSGYNTSFTINPANNQISGFTYDASGNVTAEPSPISATFKYNAEDCNTSYSGNGSSATYLCDGNNLRVKKVVTGTNAITTVYIRSNGEVIAEYDNGAAGTAPTREYIFGNQRLATIVGSTSGAGGTITYEHRDLLSPRVYTDINGNNVGEQGTYPFGESWYQKNATSNWIFTSYEQDQESGLDYALARSYSGSLGRFQSPDPLEGIVGDPQSSTIFRFSSFRISAVDRSSRYPLG